MSRTGTEITFTDLAGNERLGFVMDQGSCPWSMETFYVVKCYGHEFRVPASRVIR